MAERRKKSVSTGTRKSSKSTKSAGTRRKAPKVKLSSRYVILLTLVIVILCGGLLGVAGYMASLKSKNVQGQNVSKSVKTPSANTSEKKVSAQKTPVTPFEKVQSKPVQPSTQKTGSAQTKQPSQQKQQPQQTQKTQPSVKNLQPQKSVKESVSVKMPDTTKAAAVARVNSVNPSENPPVVKDPFNLPPARNGATLVFVIDDAGLNVANVKRYANLPMPLTIAVLPKLSNSKGCAYVVRSSGKELILHQPMQAQNLKVNPGPGAVTVDMGTAEIERIVKENIEEIGPGVKGVNNHEGSLITANEIKIGAVLEACHSKGIYFLDSRTTAETKARMAALEHDTKFFEKAGPYIDNVTTRAAELERIKESLEYANRHGTAVVIGHVDKSVEVLPDLLAEMYPWMVKAGYRFATPSTLK